MRHAHAVAESAALADRERFLSPEGRAAARRGAVWLLAHGGVAGAGQRPQVVVASPLVRAVQTAEIVASALGLDDVEVMAALAPEGAPADVAERLRRRGVDALVIGHEPGISGVVACLLGASEQPILAPAQIVVVDGGAVVASS
jgi:phosphohistidine phosphatase